MKLLMIRHPVTVANMQGVVQYGCGGEVTKKGYEQIQKLVNRLQLEHFDNCYSSDTHRCRILAEAISSSKGIFPQYSYLFREINNGVWDGRKKEEVERLILPDPINFRPEKGESLQDLVNRAIQGLEFIKLVGGERNILISHGWFLKIFLGLQLRMSPLDAIKTLKFSNCAISEINLTKQGCLIEYLNNRDYLTL